MGSTRQRGSLCHVEIGCVELISTGTSLYASSLLGVSADGTDAYFFTREKLATEDENGNTVKIYDARAFGGFPFVPPAVPCKASDECHGPASRIRRRRDPSISPAPRGNEEQEGCDASRLADRRNGFKRAEGLRKRAQAPRPASRAGGGARRPDGVQWRAKRLKARSTLARSPEEIQQRGGSSDGDAQRTATVD